jgi:hypothetical protein
MVSGNASYTFNALANHTIEAQFVQQVQVYTINVSASPSVAGSVTGGGVYTSNTSVTVVATAASGWEFTGWFEGGVLVSGNASYTFEALANHTFKAHFAQQIQVYTIMLSANPPEGGVVSGGGSVNAGTQVNVLATANQGWVFTNWTEAGNVVSASATYTFTASASRTITANFVQVLSVTTAVHPENAGTVTGAGSYNASTTVSVQAFANPGYRFYCWTEDGNPVSTQSLYSFMIFNNRALVANFLSTVDIPETKASPLKVYPNPTDAMVKLETSGASISRVVVSEPSGKVIFQLFPTDADTKVLLDLSGLQDGVYAIKVSTSDGIVTSRKVVLHK